MIEKKVIRIASRKSALALAQTEFVKMQLQALYPEIEIVIIKIMTKGDKLLNQSLFEIGGKALFLKELEEAMLSNEADIAVHSVKDIPMELPPQFQLISVLNRLDPRDAFLSNHYDNINSLPANAVIGTCSLRRQSQLKRYRPDLKLVELRGNINTRIDKLDRELFDGIILAASGLHRLNLQHRIRQYLSPEFILPACGQGALGIECVKDDKLMQQLVLPLNEETVSIRISAERAMNRVLNGSCKVPIGCYSVIEGNILWLRGLVATPDGKMIIQEEIRGDIKEAVSLGESLAYMLLSKGADKILNNI